MPKKLPLSSATLMQSSKRTTSAVDKLKALSKPRSPLEVLKGSIQHLRYVHSVGEPADGSCYYVYLNESIHASGALDFNRFGGRPVRIRYIASNVR